MRIALLGCNGSGKADICTQIAGKFAVLGDSMPMILEGIDVAVGPLADWRTEICLAGDRAMLAAQAKLVEDRPVLFKHTLLDSAAYVGRRWKVSMGSTDWQTTLLVVLMMAGTDAIEIDKIIYLPPTDQSEEVDLDVDYEIRDILSYYHRQENVVSVANAEEAVAILLDLADD